MIVRFLSLTLACCLAAGCAAAAAEIGWADADDNDDDTVSRAEFAGFIDEWDYFPRYDDDDDQRLDREEYREAVDSSIEGDAYFRGFDRDRDGLLTEREFSDGLFASFDRDGNGWLDRNEFQSAVEALAVEL